MNRYVARVALLPDGWAENVSIEVAPNGTYASVGAASTPDGARPLDGLVLSGMPNVHSHAFQRAIAGRTERAGAGRDSFWTWREAMYEMVAGLGPEAFEAIARDAYRAMAAAGYSHVCEFHYLHNAPDGRPYDDPNELAHRLVLAARSAGIGITLLPVLYRFSDFDHAPPHAHQRRFVRSLDAFAHAWLALRAAYRGAPDVAIGIAPHSLRAVALADLGHLQALAADGGGGAVPFHIHVSEQTREVEACRAAHGATPIELLAAHVALDATWCLVHATHATEYELALVARSGAVVGLCPTTEANLGDGIFPAAAFVRAGGRIAIGSDSNVTIDVAEELRWLEYGQRLTLRERNVLCDAASPSPARFLYERCAAGGGLAAGLPVGALAPGARAGATVLPCEPNEDPDTTLSQAIFRSNAWHPLVTLITPTTLS